jgi:hypothetical protein
MTDRLEVRKTYKLFVGAPSPARSPAGRTRCRPRMAARGPCLPRLPQGPARRRGRPPASRAGGWAGRTAYNRAQILYRVAEMLEGRSAAVPPSSRSAAPPTPTAEVAAAVDRWVWYAGWADKFAQVLGSHNPVAGPYFNVHGAGAVGVAGSLCP